MSDTSGPTLRTPFAFYDPDESCWRTSQATFLWDSDRYSATWPRSGMTRDGFAYELPMPALRMVASAFSSLLPTPGVAGGGKKIPEDAIWSGKAAYKQDGRKVQVHLDQIARLLPTPNARDWKGQPGPGWDEQASLPRAVALLPTPRAQIGEERNQTCWQRPLDEPQNLENALARLPGVPTRLRSNDGNTSLGEPPHDQLSLDAAESA